MMVREWEEGENGFQYEERGGQITVLQWKGTGNLACIPAQIEGIPVTSIGKKAFLSNKRVQEAILPEDVSRVGDWAFAYCDRLTRIWMPRRKITFGKGVFLGCERLEQIRLQKNGEDALSAEDMACTGSLLAAAVSRMEDDYLLSPLEAGGRPWLQKWDARLVQVMGTPDEEGYSKTLLCGEEDYGSRENNLDYFLSQKRRGKARLAMLRLLHPKGLSEDLRDRLEEYVRCHTKGCAHEEAWQVVREEYGPRREYYDLLLDTGALTEKNFDAALLELGTELAEMKAYLLRARQERFGRESFFDSLEI